MIRDSMKKNSIFMKNFYKNEVSSGGLTYVRQITYLKHYYNSIFSSITHYREMR